MRAWILFLLMLGAAFGQKQPVTLEPVRPSGATPAAPSNPLAWSPDGSRFLFRQGTSLQIYDAATQTSAELLDTDKLPAAKVETPDTPQPFAWENRRVAESPVQWAATGAKVLFSNEGALFWINAMTGAFVQLPVTGAHDPKLSPDGRSVAFRLDWDLYTLDVESGKRVRLTSDGRDALRNGGLDWVYPEELDLGTAFWWSPDSQSIAYLRFDVSGEPLYPQADLRRTRALAEPQRYPQAGERNPDVRLGVVAAKGGRTRWFDVGNTVWDYLIASVTWTADSKKLYVVRPNRVQSTVELLAFDVESRKATKVLSESDLYWVNVNGAPEFVNGGTQFLWLSERDGFRHIYLYSSDGTLVRQITSGAWEVTSIDEATDGRVYFTSSEASPLERHAYVVGLDGQGKRLLTPGGGTHSIRVGPGAKYYVESFSSVTNPPRATLHSGDGRELAVYREADRRVLEQYEILPTELSSFHGPDGSTLYTRLIKPADFDPSRKYPAVIQVYGGPGAQGPRNAWYGADFDQVLAHAGFVVWQVDNRGSAGRGHAFEIPLFRNMGPVELADQVAGVRQLVSMGFVDAARVGIRGWSYGGFMTLNAMLNAPDVFRAGAAGAPVTDWRNYDTIYTERYMGLPEANADGYKNTALPLKAANLKGSLLILHNYQDDNVLFQNSLQMIDALERAGKQFELTLYTQKTHGVTGPEARHVDAAMLGFFQRALK